MALDIIEQERSVKAKVTGGSKTFKFTNRYGEVIEAWRNGDGSVHFTHTDANPGRVYEFNLYGASPDIVLDADEFHFLMQVFQNKKGDETMAGDVQKFQFPTGYGEVLTAWKEEGIVFFTHSGTDDPNHVYIFNPDAPAYAGVIFGEDEIKFLADVMEGEVRAL